MTEEEKEDKKAVFMEWTTFIEDRVNSWLESANPEIREYLDYSPESLERVEQYLLNNYHKETLAMQENKIPIDALVSYYGETLRRNIPGSTWYIELDDDTSVDFSSPAVRAPIGPLLGLYWLLKRVFAKNSGDFLYSLYQKMKVRNQ